MLAAEAIYHYLSLFYYIVSSQVVDTGSSGWFRRVELSWDAMRGLAQEPDRRYSWNIPSLLYIRVTWKPEPQLSTGNSVCGAAHLAHNSPRCV